MNRPGFALGVASLYCEMLRASVVIALTNLSAVGIWRQGYGIEILRNGVTDTALADKQGALSTYADLLEFEVRGRGCAD